MIHLVNAANFAVSQLKQEPQEIAMPNIPASQPSTRQKVSNRKDKHSVSKVVILKRSYGP